MNWGASAKPLWVTTYTEIREEGADPKLLCGIY